MATVFNMVGGGGGGGIKLESIAITTAPTKTAYKGGERFDTAGMVVEATYSNGATLTATGYAYEPSGDLTVDDTAVTIRYTEGGVTKTATQAITVTRTELTVPSQSGSLTYSGSAQSPTWTGYDSAKMTIGGATSGTNAGSYSATFSLSDTGMYCWGDGTLTDKTVTWSIGKAAGSMSISPTSLTLNSSATSGTITVTRAGDGAISASSSNTGVATVSVSGNTITVNSVNSTSGSATITVSVAEGTNYTEPASVTCEVTAEFVRYLNDYTWDEISQISDAGQGANYWSVGDTKTITINGTVGNTTFSNLSVDAFILGFNHNSAKEGTNRIHFKIGKIGGNHIALVDSNYGNSGSSASYFQMNASNTNSGGWSSSSMRKTLLGNSGTPTSPTSGSLLAALPSDLRAVMKSVTKYSDNTGGGSNTASYVTSTTDYLFLLSEYEYHGARTYANSAEQNFQAQYDYYKAGNSKIHYKHNATGTAAYAWCRSVYSSTSDTFCFVTASGGAGNSYAYRSRGVSPGFCV